MPKILGRTSSFNVRKVLWLCDELAIPFHREDWGEGYKSPQSPEFLALNPNAMIPVIQDENFVMWESNAIIRYLTNAKDGA
ncbi:glutathione S-transferase N-terminal domain-containing protein [Pectobacterium odoriferum]|uniref:glutathione S-transferase N-terminal domain-containing protein n=1 Tax=Pectobacterium odoriferum TaxID=78398 RepID=UPI000AA5E43A